MSSTIQHKYSVAYHVCKVNDLNWFY